MTPAEYAALTEWMLPRWGEMSKWSEAQIAAMFDDLARWPAADVQEVVEGFWLSGREWAPKGGQIVAVLRDRPPAVRPELRTSAVSWPEAGVSELSLVEYVRSMRK